MNSNNRPSNRRLRGAIRVYSEYVTLDQRPNNEAHTSTRVVLGELATRLVRYPEFAIARRVLNAEHQRQGIAGGETLDSFVLSLRTRIDNHIYRGLEFSSDATPENITRIVNRLLSCMDAKDRNGAEAYLTQLVEMGAFDGVTEQIIEQILKTGADPTRKVA